jgi:hypothetical protein
VVVLAHLVVAASLAKATLAVQVLVQQVRAVAVALAE